MTAASLAQSQDQFRTNVQLKPAQNLMFDLKKANERGEVTTHLEIHNLFKQGQRLAYKIKTTQPPSFSVKPSQGIVEPDALSRVEIMYAPHVDVSQDPLTLWQPSVDIKTVSFLV